MNGVSVATAVVEEANRICRPTEPANLGGLVHPTFRRADFRLRWMATRMHTFVFVIDLSGVGHSDPVGLAEEARDWAREHKGGLPRGMQTGSTAMPVIVATEIETLRAWAKSPQPLKFAVGLFPIVVSGDGRDSAYRQTSQRIGVVYESFFRGLAGQLTAAGRSGTA